MSVGVSEVTELTDNADIARSRNVKMILVRELIFYDRHLNCHRLFSLEIKVVNGLTNFSLTAYPSIRTTPRCFLGCPK